MKLINCTAAKATTVNNSVRLFKKLLLGVFVFLSLAVGEKSWGQVAAWDFTGQNTGPATVAATTFNVNLVSTSGASNITRGSGAAASSANNSFRTTGFQNNGISTANTDYFQVTLTAATGYKLSLSTIDANFGGTASFNASPGVTSQFAYSTDGSTFTLIGSSVQSTSLAMTQISLTGISALQNVSAGTTVYLRYYASGQTTTGGWGFLSAASAGTNGLAIGGSVTPSYTVTYDGNINTGGTAPVDGSSPYASGATVTVLGAGSLVKTGNTFNNWNTAANGSGTAYAPTATFAIAANTTLYAQWVAAPPVHNVNQNTYYTTIQAAITAANPNDVISILPGYVHNGIRLTITKNLTIDGNGETIDAGFDITSAAVVTIQHLKINNIPLSGGMSSQSSNPGEQIVSSVLGAGSKLTLDDVTLTVVRTTGGNYYNLVGVNLGAAAELVLKNSTFNLTNESNVYGVYAQSGGPKVTITNTVFNPSITPASLPNRSMIMIGHEFSANNILATVSLSGNTYNPVFSNPAQQVFYEMYLYAYPTTLTNTQINAYLASVLTSGQTARVVYSGSSVNDIYPGPVHNVDLDIYYSTIQPAIDAASATNTITVAAGTYTEAVVINKSLHLTGAAGAIIAAPATLPVASDPASNIVTISGAGVSVEINGFTIQGAGPSSCGSIGSGIFVRDGAYANIHNNSILNIADNPFGGCQNGIAIRVGKQSLATSGTATIANNIISGYQKGGIVVDNTGSNAVITGNTVTGAGTTNITAQNGIQISRGATATLTGNTISGNSYHDTGNPSDWAACGILLYQSGAVSLAGGNNISGNDQNYYDEAVTGALSLGAEIFGSSTAPLGFGNQIANASAQNIDARNCTFNGVSPAAMSMTQLFDLEDFIYHSIDNPTTGFVYVKTSNDYITTNSFDAGSGYPNAQIQRAVNAASSGWTVNVRNGSYPLQQAVDSYIFGTSGPYKFGLFLNKDNLTIRGYDGSDNAVSTASAAAVNITTNATNNFGTSGIFVQANGTSLEGLKIGDNYNDASVRDNNKTIEIIGDAFNITKCWLSTASDEGTLYMGRWDASHPIASYTISQNKFENTLVSINNGAGITGPRSGRVITNNEFTGVATPYLIGFRGWNGAGPVQGWIVDPVGGAVVTSNAFNNTGVDNYVVARGNAGGYINSELDWSEIWNTNTYGNHVATLTNYPGFDVRTYTDATGYPETRRISTKIQENVDIAQTGDVVLASAGTYAENVLVNKEVTINGAGEGLTIVVPAISDPGDDVSPSFGNSQVMIVSANNVTISNLTIDGNNPSISSGVIRNGVDIDARNGIIESDGPWNNLHVTHVTAKNIYLRGIYARSGGNGFHIDHNTVQNVDGGASSIAIFNFGGSGIIEYNNVSMASDAIAANWSRGTIFTNNTVTNSGSGIHTDNNGGAGGVADLIQDNQVSNSTLNGYGIFVFAPYLPAQVKDNTISNVDVGLTCTGQNSPVTILFSGNTVDGQSKANSTGVYITTDLFGYGTADVSVNFVNNFVTNNADGFYLESQTGKTLTLTANDNSITPNSNSNVTQAVGANGAGTFNLNMECNWWGTASYAGIAPTISGAAVDYLPYLTNGTDDAPGTAGFQPVAGSCTGAGPVLNVNTNKSYITIQAAIDDATTVTGNTIQVSAGTYAEDVTVTKSLTILGPNAAIDPCSGTRVPEAIVVPATAAISSGEIFHVAASNVTISGFTIDGDNPSLTSGFTSTNGADIDAAEGITVYETGINNLTVTNNIIQNLSYTGVTLYDYPAGVPSSGHVIAKNKIQNLGTYDAGSGIANYGIGVLLYNNQYAAVTNNCMSNVRLGVQTGNFYQANPGGAGSQVISGNTISARRRGIFHNLFYGTASPYTISGNTITGVADANETASWDAMLISSMAPTASTASNNTINGSAITAIPTTGISVWNDQTAPLITGGTITGVKLGINVNNYEGYGPSNAGNTLATIDGVTITGATIAGIKVNDNVLNTNGATVAAEIKNTTINGAASSAGILVSGSDASANIHNNPSTITGTAIAVDIDGGAATVYRNNITANGTGIRVQNNGTLTSATENFITNNTVDGIRVEASAGTIGGIHTNDLSGNTGKAINNLSSPTLDATCNWYGTTIPATVAGKISGNVNYIVYLASGADEQPAIDGFQNTSCSPIVNANPALIDVYITDMSDVTIDANQIPYNSVNKLKVPVQNLDLANSVPSGTTTIRIDLGTKLKLNPGFDLTTAPLSDKFTWTLETGTGNDVLVGVQKGTGADLGPLFYQIAEFDVVAVNSGISIVNADFLITNHNNPAQFLVDTDPSHNHGELNYTVLDEFKFTSVTSTNVTCNGSNDGTITVNVSGGASPYDFSNDNGTTWTLAQPSTFTFNNLISGNYTIQVRDAISQLIVYVSNPVVINQPAVLSATVTSTNVTCNGANDGTITITSPLGGYGTYEYRLNAGAWQPGGSFTGLANAIYSVQIRDAAHTGCMITLNASLEITQPAVLSATVTSTNVTCNGANDGTITISAAAGGYGTYEYSIDNGTTWQASGSFTGLVPAVYQVMMQDAAHTGCVKDLDGVAGTEITQQAVLSATVASTNVTCNGANDGTITISAAAGGYGTYEYSIDNGATWQASGSFTGLSPAVYQVMMQDAAHIGCVKDLDAAAGTEITEPLALTLAVTDHINLASVCYNTGSITVTAGGGTLNYQFKIDGGSWVAPSPANSITYEFTGLGSGLHTMNVKDANGCEKSTSFTLTEPLNTDLSLGSDLSNNNFVTNGTSNVVVYNISEMTGKTATPVVLRVYKVAGYNILFNAADATVTLPGFPNPTVYPLDNGNWSVTTNNTSFMEFTRNAALPCVNIKYFKIDLQRATPNKTKFNLNAVILPAITEINFSNNYNSTLFTGN